MEQQVKPIKAKPSLLPKDSARCVVLVCSCTLVISVESFKAESLKEMVEEDCETDTVQKSSGKKKIQSSLDEAGEWEYTQAVPGAEDAPSLLNHLEALDEEPRAHSTPSSPSSRSGRKGEGGRGAKAEQGSAGERKWEVERTDRGRRGRSSE
eukprot:572313-Hanusia_phi.AAC.2